MKIAHIDSNYGFGSTGKIVKKIHQFLLQKKHQSVAFYGRGDNVNELGVFKISNNIEVFLSVGLSRVTGYTDVYSHLATSKLIKHLRVFKPDIVHLHELHGYYLHQYKLFDYLLSERVPIVWTLHCENAYTGRCGYSFDCNQWMIECIKCPRLSDYPKSFFFDRSRYQFNKKKYLFTNADLITLAPVSNWLHSRVKQSFLANKDAVVVHNGIDVKNVFFPRNVDKLKQKHNIKNEFIFLSVAPDLMSSRKGGEWIIRLADSLRGKPVKFIMIGIDKKYSNLPNNIISLESINDQDLLAQYYSLASAFLITSQRETFSLTTAEALSCGTPVIGFDSGGPLEIAPKPYGHFVPFGDIQGLLKLCFDLLTNKLSLPESKECALYAQQMFDDNLMCENYMNIYKKLYTLKATL